MLTWIGASAREQERPSQSVISLPYGLTLLMSLVGFSCSFRGSVTEFSIIGTQYREIPRTNDIFDSASLIRSSIIPTSPLIHSTGFTICTISLYHKLFVSFPRLGVQPFAKTICDLEGVAFHPHLSSQIYAALQLLFLMLYVVGCSLEDGEGRERFFNVLNSLAPITCHQSAFHRRQAISEFLYYKDIKTYSNLSKFLYSNYKQALGITSTRDALSTSMKNAGITSPQVFYDWLVNICEACAARRPRRPWKWNTT